ncbi:GNAT family N-acetyltransferase [Pseudomonas sp. CrR25]|nr:GNAT family N-acetyltransferase [Pseudomonas sp. CrR25]
MLSPIEPINTLDEILPLLAACDLPRSDLATSKAPQFFGIRSEMGLAAVIGFERFDRVALLRSLAVAPSHRGLGVATLLVDHLEQVARDQGVDHLYLLTDSAAALFDKLGYRPMARSAAPSVIRATPQFSGLCPASSAFLHKALGAFDSAAGGALEVNRR